MRKIISLFKRDYEGTRQVYDEVVPGAEWVLAGEGVATRKWDGTCCMVRDGRLYKRYDAKYGKTPPASFEPAQDPDPKTGHWPGWVPVGEGPEDVWFMGAWYARQEPITDGTYELVGPKINGNRDGFESHLLVPHGECWINPPRDFAGLRAWLADQRIEGVVWHHPDGRMVKIKRTDFGLSWPVKLTPSQETGGGE